MQNKKEVTDRSLLFDILYILCETCSTYTLTEEGNR